MERCVHNGSACIVVVVYELWLYCSSGNSVYVVVVMVCECCGCSALTWSPGSPEEFVRTQKYSIFCTGGRKK